MCNLTDRERQVLELLQQMETKMVAEKLGIKAKTVYRHKGNVRAKVEMARDFLKQVKPYKNVMGVSTRIPR